jgi:hypothetical protein
MSRNRTRDIESEMGRHQVRFRCSCGETITGESERVNGEMDLSTECDGCGRRHVVTITEVEAVVRATPTLE